MVFLDAIEIGFFVHCMALRYLLTKMQFLYYDLNTTKSIIMVN